MNRININNGSFNYSYQLLPIIYSYLIFLGIKTLLKLLVFSNNIISNFQEVLSKNYFKIRVMKLRRILRIKNIIYFI